VKLRISETFSDPKTAPQGIVILCDGEFLKETNIAMKATFNRSSTKAIAERPDGLNFKYIEYYAEPKSKTPAQDANQTTNTSYSTKFTNNKTNRSRQFATETNTQKQR
jgi:hypothetical protein